MEHLKRILARQANGEFPHSSQINNKTNIEQIGNKTSVEDHSENKISCSICQDRGLVIDSEDIARPCKCMKQKALINRFKSAQLSKEMMNCTFKNFRSHYYSKNYIDPIEKISSYTSAEKAYNGAKRFVSEFLKGESPDGLMFSGSVGCGKTYLASSIANAVLEHGIEVLFIVVPDLLDEIKATYNNDYNTSNTEHSLLETARQVPLLILDDLGAHNYTDWVRNKIYSIINYRLNNNLATVITTNLDLNELKEFLGERTTSRIIQMCQLYLLIVEEDIRIAKRKENKNSHK